MEPPIRTISCQWTFDLSVLEASHEGPLYRLRVRTELFKTGMPSEGTVEVDSDALESISMGREKGTFSTPDYLYQNTIIPCRSELDNDIMIALELENMNLVVTYIYLY